MEEKELKIGIVQFNPIRANLEANLNKAFDIINKNNKADIYLFPELFLSGYLFESKEEVKKLSLLQSDYIFEKIIKFTEQKKIAIAGGYIENESGRFFNSSFFIGEGKFLLNYRKVHLFNDEKDFFTPSASGFKVVEYKSFKFGMMICFDWIFPEAARTLTLKGAQVILHPANLVLPYCQNAMITRAMENRVFIVTSNRIGIEKVNGKVLKFTGKSQIVDPSGRRLISFPKNKETIKIARIYPELANQKMITPKNNVILDRRPDQYIM
ncbi:MAG: nitrilase-related carbon-nitrogen hydrolase [Exilispira sp.]